MDITAVLVSNIACDRQMYACRTMDIVWKFMVLIVAHGCGVGGNHICSCVATTTGVGVAGVRGSSSNGGAAEVTTKVGFLRCDPALVDGVAVVCWYPASTQAVQR